MPPATDIVFALESDGNVIDRYGCRSYAKGETSGTASKTSDRQRSAAHCREGTFADGSVWSNGPSLCAGRFNQSHEVSIESIFPSNPIVLDAAAGRKRAGETVSQRRDTQRPRATA